MYRDCTQSDLNVTANPHAGWPWAVYRVVGSYPSGTRLAEAVRAGCARTCNLIAYIDKKRGRVVAPLFGVLLAISVGVFATGLNSDRDRAFYLVVMTAIASFYALSAMMGGFHAYTRA
jgi:hypothetical protein